MPSPPPAWDVGVGPNGCGIRHLAGVEHESPHATAITAAATVPRGDQLHEIKEESSLLQAGEAGVQNSRITPMMQIWLVG